MIICNKKKKTTEDRLDEIILAFVKMTFLSKLTMTCGKSKIKSNTLANKKPIFFLLNFWQSRLNFMLAL